MLLLFVRMPPGVVPVVGERFYWGKFAMDSKKGSEVCVCAQTHMHVGAWERKCVHLINEHVPELFYTLIVVTH
jgi:hypothetical protein